MNITVIRTFYFEFAWQTLFELYESSLIYSEIRKRKTLKASLLPHYNWIRSHSTDLHPASNVVIENLPLLFIALLVKVASFTQNCIIN